MRRPMLLAAVGFVSGIGGVSACGGNDTLEDPLFAAEVTGAVTRTVAGVSAFGVVRDGGLTGFTFVMEDEAGTTIILQKPTIAKPVLGSYEIVAPEQVGPIDMYRGVARIIVDGALEEFTAQSGTLIITEATPTSLKGTFEFGAVRTSPCCDPEPVAIQVTGTYTAIQGPVAALR